MRISKDYMCDSSARSVPPSLHAETIERKIDVLQHIMLKRVVENVDKELSLVATFIQTVWHDNDKEVELLDTSLIDMDTYSQGIEKLSKEAFFWLQDK